MLELKYRVARTVDEALETAARIRGEFHYVGGGTDLVVRAKSGRLGPSTWIDVSRIPELKGIEERDGGVTLGAAATFLEIERSNLVRRSLPLLWQAVREVGSPQIRALGTMGGNCGNASPAGDSIPPLYVHGATVVVRGPGSTRRIAAADLFRGPGQTVLEPGELIVSFFLPLWTAGRALWLKLGPRHSLSCSKVSAATIAELDDGAFVKVAIALGAVAPTVIRATRTEAFLAGKRPSPELFEEAAAIARTETRPITDYRCDADYRREMSGSLVARALGRLTGVGAHGSSGWDVEMR